MRSYELFATAFILFIFSGWGAFACYHQPNQSAMEIWWGLTWILAFFASLAAAGVGIYKLTMERRESNSTDVNKKSYQTTCD